jgi:hypothetical protein
MGVVVTPIQTINVRVNQGSQATVPSTSKFYGGTNYGPEIAAIGIEANNASATANTANTEATLAYNYANTAYYYANTVASGNISLVDGGIF